MANKTPLILAADGLPSQMQSGDTVPVANGGTGVITSTGSGSNVLSASPTHTGIVTFATDGTNGYPFATGNANGGSGIGTFMCYDGTGGRMGCLDWTGPVRKPFGFYGTNFTFNYGTGASTVAVFTADSTGITTTGVCNSTGNQLISGTGAQGYATGSGGTVTQATSKSTGVTLNKTNGSITMNAAALAASTSVAFTLTNSTIAATDVVNVSIQSGATTLSYVIVVEATAAASCRIALRNVSAGSLSEAVVINFAVLKAVNA